MTTVPNLTAQEVFDRQGTTLQLRWLAGADGRDRLLEHTDAKYPGLALVGHLSLIHPNRVQVLGEHEFRFLEQLDEQRLEDALQRLFNNPASSMVIVAGERDPLPRMLDLANQFQMPLLGSSEPSPRLIDTLQFYLAGALAARVTQHGVFLEVMGIGVLLTGDSGIGKSEVALELLSRNHRLVADDVVELSRVAPHLLEGRCPEALRDFIEVRGLGILDVRAMFGETATKRAKYLRLIVRLEHLDKTRMSKLNRLQADTHNRSILGVEVPEVVIPVAPGRNLAVLVEAAARNHIQQMRGRNALQDFMAQQQVVMQRNAGMTGPPPRTEEST